MILLGVDYCDGAAFGVGFVEGEVHAIILK